MAETANGLATSNGLAFGLTSTGLVVPTYLELLDAIQIDFQRRYGPNIPLTGNSNFGILSMIYAYHLAKYYQQLQMVFYSAYVTTATGTGLDRLASNANLHRYLATRSQTSLHIVTEEEYLIQIGTQFETDGGTVFNTMDNVITEQQADGTYAVDARAIADDYGAYTNVPADTITIVTDPDADIVSVTNPKESNGGIDDERDDELRRRIISETVANPSATINGIKSALLNVAGVRQVGDVQNQTGETDSYGNPPYTVHIYVLGGAKDDILAALGKYSGFGPLFTGSESGQVADVTGDLKTYYFDYATPVSIYVNVALKTNSNWDVDGGPDEIKQLITDYLNDLSMGANIVLTKMYPDIYSMDGVDEATITIGRTADTLTDTDIQLDKFEAAQCTADYITISEGASA